MALSDFSNIVVSGAGAPLTRVGFGTLALAAYHTHFPERSRTYTSLPGMVDDGFSDVQGGEPAYRMAQAAFAQNPRLSSVKILRLALPSTMSQRITPIAVHSATYTITIQIAGKPAAEISYTADSATSVDEICDGLQAAIEDVDDAGEALEGLTVTPLGGATATALDLSAAAGVTFYLSDWDPALIHVEDRTPDAGIATDLNAIRNEDSDWYGFATDQNGEATAEEAADWAETQDVLYATNTSDYDALDVGSTDDIQSILASKSYVRTICYFDLDHQDGYMGAAGLAERFPFDPGQGPDAGGVFHARTLGGVTADNLTPAQKEVLQDKGYTVYISTAGVAHTLGGASASGEFLDYTRFVDWFRIRLAERKAQAIISNGRISYDARGIAIVEALCRAQLLEGLRSGGISAFDENGNPPSVVCPPLSETTSADRAERVYPGVQIQFKYAGAIHFIGPTTITVTI